MNASPIIKDSKEQKTDVHLQTSGKNGKKNSIKVPYVVDRIDSSKWPTIRDGIQKEAVHRERQSQANWEKRYGYLSGKFFQKILAEEAEKAGLPSDIFKRKETNTLSDKKCTKKLPPSPPIPKTSLAFVGWRSSREEYRLEFEGMMYISPKRTISPPLEPDAVPMTHQRFIFLG